jgi:hypothetical protein
MKLNIVTGTITSKNIGGSVTIKPERTSSLFSVVGNKGTTLMNIGNNNYYLQSESYSAHTRGFRLNL